MDDETRKHLDAMEARMMSRINANHEQTLDRLRAVDITLNSHTELMRSTNTLMSLVVTAIGDFTKRITDLEKKNP